MSRTDRSRWWLGVLVVELDLRDGGHEAHVESGLRILNCGLTQPSLGTVPPKARRPGRAANPIVDTLVFL